MDNGTNFPNGSALNTWFEQGFVQGVGGGLPTSGSIFSSYSQSSHHYQMADYTTNNAILIDQNHQSANITPISSASYSAIAFLTAGANISGRMTNICIIQHADGVNETNFSWATIGLIPATTGRLLFMAMGGSVCKIARSTMLAIMFLTCLKRISR